MLTRRRVKRKNFKRRARNSLSLYPVKVCPFPKGFQLGCFLQARPQNSDELFYPGILIARKFQLHPKLKVTYTVQYDDGVIEENLEESSLIRFPRTFIYVGESVIVEDCPILVNKSIRRVRLLHFKESLGLYQSGLLLTSNSVNQFDFSVLPFEVNQAMLLGLAIINEYRGVLPHKVCFLGVGGGSLPSCFINEIIPGADVHIVDSSIEVLKISSTYFGLPMQKVKIHLCDGIEFLMEECTDFEMVVIDVADPRDRFLPPYEFLSPTLFEHLFKANPNILVVLNVLPYQEVAADHFENTCNLFHAVPGAHCYSLYIDPNYLFFVWKFNCPEPFISAKSLVEMVEKCPQMTKAVPAIRDFVIKNEQAWQLHA